MALFHQALSFSFFLVLVADRRGLSLYGHDRICSILGLGLNEYIQARDELIDEDLIAFNGRLFQALSLPKQPRRSEMMQPPLLQKKKDMGKHDPATIRQIIATHCEASMLDKRVIFAIHNYVNQGNAEARIAVLLRLNRKSVRQLPSQSGTATGLYPLRDRARKLSCVEGTEGKNRRLSISSSITARARANRP